MIRCVKSYVWAVLISIHCNLVFAPYLQAAINVIKAIDSELECKDKKIAYFGVGTYFHEGEIDLKLRAVQALPQFMIDAINEYGAVCQCINIDPEWFRIGSQSLIDYITEKFSSDVLKVIAANPKMFTVLRGIDYFDVSPSLLACSTRILVNKGVVALSDFMHSDGPHTTVYRWYNKLYNQDKNRVIFFEWNDGKWNEKSRAISSVTVWYNCPFSVYEDRILDARLEYLEKIKEVGISISKDKIIKDIRWKKNISKEPRIIAKANNMEARLLKKTPIKDALAEDYALFNTLYAMSDEEIVRDFWIKLIGCRWAPIDFPLTIEKSSDGGFIIKDPHLDDINLGDLTEAQKKRFSITPEIDAQLKAEYKKYQAAVSSDVSKELASLHNQLTTLAALVP